MSPDVFAATLVGGVINGGLYALLAIAIVLIFSTTGVANFAQGELATFAAFVMLMMVVPTGISLIGSWVVTVTIMAAAGVACQITDIFSSAYPTPAQRPLNSRLDCSGLARYRLTSPNWYAALPQIIKDLT